MEDGSGAYGLGNCDGGGGGSDGDGSIYGGWDGSGGDVGSGGGWSDNVTSILEVVVKGYKASLQVSDWLGAMFAGVRLAGGHARGQDGQLGAG